MVVEFFVPGSPAPGGSKKAFVLRRRDGSLVTRPNGSPIVNIVDDAKRNKPWRQSVQAFARSAHKSGPLSGPLEVAFDFIVARPKHHIGARGVKPSAPKYPAVRPDCTKLVRAAEDALLGILYADDAQIVRQTASKNYGDEPGLRLRIMTIGDTDEPAPAAAELFA